MSTAILPDDSVVIRLARETIHLDAKTRAIHVRAAHAGRDLGGSMLASYPLSAAERVRVTKIASGRFSMSLDLRSKTIIDLGEAPTQDVAMLTARVIADLTRCKIEVSGGVVTTLPGRRPSTPALLEEPTGRIPWEDDTVPPARILIDHAPEPAGEPDTDPPDDWSPVRAGEAPWAQEAFAELDLAEKARSSKATAAAPVAPVFLELLRESELAAARSPFDASEAIDALEDVEVLEALDAQLLSEPVQPQPLGPPEHLPTQVGVGGWRGRSTTATRLRAIFEMLRVTTESLPEARVSLCDLSLP